MWAVGRLSLLSRGRAQAPPVPAVELAPIAPTKAPPTLRPDPIPAPTPVSEPAPAAVESIGILQRIVNRVGRFFRSLFG